MRTRHRVAVCSIVVFASLLSAEHAAAQKCPPLPNQVNVHVRTSLSFDVKNGLYTYEYTVTNDSSSTQEADGFAVDFAPPISNVSRPQGWSGRKPLVDRSTMFWSAQRVANPDRVTNDAKVPPSIVQIKRGDSMSGFSFQSPNAPGLVSYFAIGYIPPEAQPGATGVDDADAELNAEVLAEKLAASCPMIDRPILEQAATGLAVGPVNALAVQVQVKPGSTPAPVNPKSQGVLPVAILGSKTIDVRTIDSRSVRLGIGQASPQNGGHFADVNGDGIPDLLLQFPTQGAGIQCGDTALTVSGNTASGNAITGFDTIRTVGCP